MPFLHQTLSSVDEHHVTMCTGRSPLLQDGGEAAHEPDADKRLFSRCWAKLAQRLGTVRTASASSQCSEALTAASVKVDMQSKLQS